MADHAPLADVLDLLTADEKEALHSDLREMARQRRRAIDAARDWPMT